MECIIMSNRPRTTQILIDRLQQAITAHTGASVSRSQAIDIAASAFGFHNSNEFTAHNKKPQSTDIIAPEIQLLGSITPNDDIGELILVRDPRANAVYAIEESFATQVVNEERRETFGISPYGGLVNLSPIINEPISPLYTNKPDPQRDLVSKILANIKEPQWLKDDIKHGTYRSEDHALPTEKFCMDIAITSEKTFWKSTAEKYIRESIGNATHISPDGMRDIINSFNQICDSMPATIQQAYDPGISYPGSEIQESYME